METAPQHTRRGFLRTTGLAVAALSGARAAARDEASPAKIAKRFHFIQMADPQLFWGKDPVGTWRKAIAHANRLKPAFVVVCGDLLNRNGNAAKVDLAKDEKRARAYLEAAATLDKRIPLHNVAGNHDVCNRPTPATLAWYRARFGKLWYSFSHAKCLFVVLESDMLKYPQGVADESAKQMAWLKKTLAESDTRGYRHKLVFMHHPMCLKSVDEKDGYFTMPRAIRATLLKLFHQHGVGGVFCGHYHGNAIVKDKTLELVTTSAVCKPLRKDPPGFRIVKVHPDRIEHTYHGYADMPKTVS